MTSPNQNTGDSQRGIGLRLREAREALGLSIADAASQLHMPVRIVEALEVEDFARIGAPVFVRGQLRSYSRLLGLPTEPIQAASGMSPIEPAALVPRTRTPRAKRIADQVGGRLVYIVITALIVLPVWVATRSHLGDDTAAPLDLPASTVAAGRVSKPAAQPPAPAEPSTLTASMTSLPARQSPGLDGATIDLQFNGDSWMQVTGPDGGKVEESLVKAGETRSYSVSSVGRIVLGNAGGVQVLHDGQAQDTTPFMRANVARFAVSSDGTIAPISN